MVALQLLTGPGPEIKKPRNPGKHERQQNPDLSPAKLPSMPCVPNQDGDKSRKRIENHHLCYPGEQAGQHQSGDPLARHIVPIQTFRKKYDLPDGKNDVKRIRRKKTHPVEEVRLIILKHPPGIE